MTDARRIYDFDPASRIVDTRTDEVVADEFCGPREARDLANAALAQGKAEGREGCVTALTELLDELNGDPADCVPRDDWYPQIEHLRDRLATLEAATEGEQ